MRHSHTEDRNTAMIVCGIGRDQSVLASEMEAVRASEGRWPRICEESCVTGALRARGAHGH